METIKFSREPFRGIQCLQEVHPKILRSQAFALLYSAFRHGAYIAGGFARVMAKYLSGMEAKSDESELAVYGYLRAGEMIDREKGPFWKVNRGDIDLFFPSPEQLEDFLTEVRSAPGIYFTDHTVTPSWSAFEFDCDQRVSVQAITRYTGPIEEVLSGFDIYNAMIAFNASELVIPEGWRELEQHQLLHVANWTSPYIIHRIAKWGHKHNLHTLTPRTAEEMGRRAYEIIDRLRKEPVEMPWGKLSYDKVAFRLRPYLKQLSNEDLVLLASVYPEDVYNQGPGAVSVLCQRLRAHLSERKVSDDI